MVSSPILVYFIYDSNSIPRLVSFVKEGRLQHLWLKGRCSTKILLLKFQIWLKFRGRRNLKSEFLPENQLVKTCYAAAEVERGENHFQPSCLINCGCCCSAAVVLQPSNTTDATCVSLIFRVQRSLRIGSRMRWGSFQDEGWSNGIEI